MLGRSWWPPKTSSGPGFALGFCSPQPPCLKVRGGWGCEPHKLQHPRAGSCGEVWRFLGRGGVGHFGLFSGFSGPVWGNTKGQGMGRNTLF